MGSPGVDTTAAHVEPGSARGLDQAAVARLRTTARANRAVELRAIVRPDRDLAAIAAADCFGVDRYTTADVRVRSVLLGSRAVEVPTYEHRAAASIAGSVDVGSVEQSDVLAKHLHGAAGHAGIEAGNVERAAIRDDACATTVECNDAVAFDERAGADHARVVDDGVEQRIGAARSEENFAAVCLDGARVERRGAERCLVDAHAD